jgi:hypothetical protein
MGEGKVVSPTPKFPHPFPFPALRAAVSTDGVSSLKGCGLASLAPATYSLLSYSGLLGGGRAEDGGQRAVSISSSALGVTESSTGAKCRRRGPLCGAELKSVPAA